jgi:rhodanese-related sulfurtransferase
MKGGFESYKKSGGEIQENKLASNIKYTAKPTGEIEPADFIAKYIKGEYRDYVFIDLREKSEIDEDKGIMLLGSQSKNIPLAELEKNSPEKNGKYIFFCASGMRAATGRDILAGKGYSDVYYLAGSVASDGNDGLKLGDRVLSSDMIKKAGKK